MTFALRFLSDSQGASLEYVVVKYLVKNVGKHRETKSWRGGVRVGGKVPAVRLEWDLVRRAARVFIRKGTPGVQGEELALTW